MPVLVDGTRAQPLGASGRHNNDVAHVAHVAGPVVGDAERCLRTVKGAVDGDTACVRRHTSVLGRCFDPEFAHASQALIAEVHAGRTVAVLSDLTLAELGPAPERVRTLVAALPPEHVDFVNLTPEAIQLGDQYLSAGVLPAGSRTDAMHIAIATVARADVVVSWNFHHIVNLRRIHGFNGVNLIQGYPPIEIRSPWEILLEDLEDEGKD